MLGNRARPGAGLLRLALVSRGLGQLGLIPIGFSAGIVIPPPVRSGSRAEFHPILTLVQGLKLLQSPLWCQVPLGSFPGLPIGLP